MKWIRSLFEPKSADDIRRELLADAERLHVQHQANAEHSAALAGLYKLQAGRLRQELAEPAHTPLRAVK